MNLALVKYSASGNDFIIFHHLKKADRSTLAKRLCDRFNGIGADGLIVLVPNKNYDFEWQFYNADGSEASMCGNGSRAAAHYAYSFNIASKEMKFLTKAGVIRAKVDKDIVESELTPFKVIKRDFKEDGFNWWLIDTGVPHLVTFVEDLTHFDKNIAKKMREKYNANVNFGIIAGPKRLGVRTYERGVEDETLACGTGMAAVFVRAFLEKKAQESANLYPKSKEELSIRIEGDKLFFKGRVKRVFETFKEEN
jgi:diaminopimelate epimerase